MSLKRTLRIVAVLSLSLTSASAFAQDDEGGEGGEDDRKVTYKAKTEIDFEGLDVSGELVKPSGSLVAETKRAAFNPLIRLRMDFNQEMVESVDEIK